MNKQVSKYSRHSLISSEIDAGSKAVLLLWILFVIYILCLSCYLVCSLQPCGQLLGKGWSLGSLMCYVFFCILSLSHVACVRCGT